MGGECYIKVTKEKVKDLDLFAYHNLLRNFKAQFIAKHGVNSISQRYHASHIEFFGEEPTNNIFAEFSYDCYSHKWHPRAYWKIFRDPSLEEDASSNVHGRCIPDFISIELAPMWKELSKTFPAVFTHYVCYEPDNGDCVKGFAAQDDMYTYPYYSMRDEMHSSENQAARDAFTPHDGYYLTGNGEYVYCVKGESADYTACDSECRYCGRCRY